MTISSYSEFQNLPASEKIVMAVFEARKRLMGWVLESGSVYKLTSFSADRIVSIEDSGTAYTRASSTSLSAGEFYHDRDNGILYLRASDSSNPNSRFLVLIENLYFSNVGISAPYDHGTWSGYEVYWRDGLDDTSEFGVETDSENQLGEAIEGKGSISFKNDQPYWKQVFAKKSFFNSNIAIYSWNRDIALSESKILFKGKIHGQSYTETDIKFNIRDQLTTLRASVELDRISDISGAKVNPKAENQYQRRVYGQVLGHMPTSIDQVDAEAGYALSGTLSVSAGSRTLTGSGTSFLTDLSPEDELVVVGSDVELTVATIESDTSLTLSEEASKTISSGSYGVKPDLPKLYTNRNWVIAGHAIREPSTTVASAESTSEITVVNATDFEEDSEILVGSEISRVRRVVGNRIRLDFNLTTIPSVGTTVKRLTVTNVRIKDRKLVFNRDYTYNASTGRMTLDQNAEFNVALTRVLRNGTVSFSSGSRTVTGVNTSFTSFLNSNSWVRARNQSTWYQVLQVISDTELELRENSAYTESNDVCLFRTPEVYDEEETPLSLDTLGYVDGSGVWLNRVPQIVEHLLEEAGLSADIDTDSFDTANDLVYQRVGYVIPQKRDDTKTTTYRKAIADLNRSVFGTLIQNPDFKFEYRPIRPNRSEAESSRFDEADCLSWAVRSQLDRIAKTVELTYLPKEHDWKSEEESEALVTYENKAAKYLAKGTKTYEHESFLVNASDANTLAQRLAFLFSVAYTTISIETKLQAARLKVSSVVDFNHKSLFDPQRKIASVKGASKTGFGSEIQVEDLADTLTQCGTITPSGANNWDSSSVAERLFHGFVTDQYGMQENDPDTFGVSRIW